MPHLSRLFASSFPFKFPFPFPFPFKSPFPFPFRSNSHCRSRSCSNSHSRSRSRSNSHSRSRSHATLFVIPVPYRTQQLPFPSRECSISRPVSIPRRTHMTRLYPSQREQRKVTSGFHSRDNGSPKFFRLRQARRSHPVPRSPAAPV